MTSMSDRIFRALLRLLPREFRDAYARDMTHTFRTEQREAGSRAHRVRLWLQTAGDIVRRAPGIHVDILRRDARLAMRTLAARPLAVGVAVLTLAVGLGANVAMFGVVDAVLLSPLPYRDAGRLVSVYESQAGEDISTMGYQTFLDVRERAASLQTSVAIGGSTATLTAPDRDAERVNAMRVSHEYFSMLGITPALGRTFLPSEDKPAEARRVAILSHALWQRRFNSDPGIIGSPITISGLAFRVVGVLPSGAPDLIADRFYRGAELWTPLGYDPAASFACRTCRHLRVFARLADDATHERANAELDQLFASLEREHPASYSQAGGAAVTLAEVFLGPVRPVLLTLWIGVMVLLLIACGNVAHLLLLRVSERRHEIAVRTALGISRSRLVRLFLTESLMLATVGGTIGLLIALGLMKLVATFGPDQIPRLATLTVGPSTWLALVVVTLIAGLAFGIVPLRSVLSAARTGGLGSETRTTDSVATWRARTALVFGNVALSLVLLIGSGLMVRSLISLLAVDPGFRTDRLLTFELWATGERFRSGETEAQIATAVNYYDDIRSRIGALPGVTGVAATTTLPLGGNFDRYGFHIEGRPAPNPEDAPDADRFVVTPDYFPVMGIRLERGRLLGSSDHRQSERTAVINEAAARTLFGGDDPIGRRINLGGPDSPKRTIIGIVANVAHPNVDDEVGPQVYVPQAQWAWAETAMTVVVRTSVDPLSIAGAVRDTVRSVDRLQPITNVRTMDAVLAKGTSVRWFTAGLLAGFAGISLLLTVVGLYGSVSLMVAQRRREIGVRLALGAGAGRIRRLVFAQGLRPVLGGLVAGLAMAAAGVPLLRSMLYELQPLDPFTFVVAAAGLVVVATAACLGPARRAGRIDPAKSVRD